MFLFAQFDKAVEQMERGDLPPRLADRLAALKALVDQICIAPWKTPEERERAQGLVARLERVRRSLQEQNGSGPSSWRPVAS